MGNISTVSWTEQAEQQLSNIFHWSYASYGRRSAVLFLSELHKTQKIISAYPYAFKASLINPRQRLAKVHPHVSLVYEIKQDEIIIQTILDHRSG